MITERILEMKIGDKIGPLTIVPRDYLLPPSMWQRLKTWVMWKLFRRPAPGYWFARFEYQVKADYYLPEVCFLYREKPDVTPP